MSDAALRPCWPAATLAVAALAALAVVPVSVGLAAEAPQIPASAGNRSTRDGVYSSHEAGRGQALYERVCTYCHDMTEFGAEYMSGWEGQPIGALFDFISATMPEDNPGDLSRQQYSDIVAYLLRVNGSPVGEQDMGNDAAQLDQILIEGPFEERADQR